MTAVLPHASELARAVMRRISKRCPSRAFRPAGVPQSTVSGELGLFLIQSGDGDAFEGDSLVQSLISSFRTYQPCRRRPSSGSIDVM